MADNQSFHGGPRSEIRRVAPTSLQPRVDGLVEDYVSGDDHVQPEHAPTHIPVTPNAPPLDVSAILPPGETPLTWFIKSQNTLNTMYAQLCMQTGTQVMQPPGTMPHGRASPAPRVLSYASYDQYHSATHIP